MENKKKVKLADIYRKLKKKGYDDEDTLKNICKETEYLEFESKLNQVEHDLLKINKQITMELQKRQKVIATAILNLKKTGDMPPKQVEKLEKIVE